MEGVDKNVNSAILKEDLLKIKSRLENLESDLQAQIKDLEEREEKWKKLDQEVEGILRDQQGIMVRINVSGKKFATKVETLLSLKDTLFYKLIVSKSFDLSQEIFFDRSPRMFSVLLDYLRYKKISYQRFTKDELIDLKIEADYYEIGPIADHLRKKKNNIEFVSFEFNGPYVYSNINVGTNNVADLSDRSCTKGIVANYPGWIIIELNDEWDIEEIEVGGYSGNSTAFSNENGAGADIQTSVDKINWTSVGKLPSSQYSIIKKVPLLKTSGRYIKFVGTSYLGIGFLEVIKK